MMPENNLQSVETFSAALSSLKLVGRFEEEQQINQILQRANKPFFLYISGVGGIGKTYLLRDTLARLNPDPTFKVASGVVDLYHSGNNTVEGLLNELYRLLDEGEPEFVSYRDAKLALDDARTHRPGETEEIIGLRQQTVDAFVNAIHELGQRRQIVIALDTVEKLVLQQDELAEKLAIQEAQVETVPWLVEKLLNRAKQDAGKHKFNLVLLLAGRPAAGELDRQMSNLVPKGNYQHLQLQGLTRDAALIYFNEVIYRLENSINSYDRRAARRVKQLSDSERQTIFHCLCIEGEPPTVAPILLGLAIEYIAIVGEPLVRFAISPQEAQTLSSDQRKLIRTELGAAVMREIVERLSPADLLLKALGWLRKGATRRLLFNAAQVFGLKSEKEAEVGWNDLVNLSFVKQRADENTGELRLFLHDEMYEIVQKNFLDFVVDPNRTRFALLLRKYYETEILKVRELIASSYRPASQNKEDALENSNLIHQYRAQLRNLIAEDIYYRLRFDLQRGFQSYFRYAEEAVSNHDQELGSLLRLEMRAYVSEVGLINKPEGIDDLRYSVIRADESVRWVKWRHAEGRYREAVALAMRLQGELFDDLIKSGGALAQAELLSWLGLLEAETGNIKAAIEFLQNSIAIAKTRPNSPRTMGILARAYNNLGYTYAIAGQSWLAIEAFNHALPLWRTLKIESELANTLTNLAFDLAKVGDFERANSLIREAIQLREKSGSQHPLGLSFNTLAEISIMDFASELAIEQSTNALSLHQSLGYVRGEGLSLRTRAEAKRRISVSPFNRRQEQTVAWLEEGEIDALGAVEIFQSKVNEPARLVWSLLELGCIYRDWMRWRRISPQELSPREKAGTRQELSIDALFDLSKGAFEQADKEAAKLGQDHYLRLEVQLKWARLLFDRYFDSSLGYLSSSAQGYVNHHFQLIEGQFAPESRSTDQHFIVWLQSAPRDHHLYLLGDWKALQGEIELQRFLAVGGDDSLRTALEHYMLALQTYHQYSNKIMRWSRRSRNRLAEQLKKVNLKTLHLVYQIVTELEEKYQLHDSAMSRFLYEEFGPIETLPAGDELIYFDL